MIVHGNPENRNITESYGTTRRQTVQSYVILGILKISQTLDFHTIISQIDN